MMTFITSNLSLLFMLGVFIVLLLGLANMLKKGSPSRSQNLMRARIVLQFIAIIFLMAVLYFKGSFGG